MKPTVFKLPPAFSLVGPSWVLPSRWRARGEPDKTSHDSGDCYWLVTLMRLLSSVATCPLPSQLGCPRALLALRFEALLYRLVCVKFRGPACPGTPCFPSKENMRPCLLPLHHSYVSRHIGTSTTLKRGMCYQGVRSGWVVKLRNTTMYLVINYWKG